MPSNKKNRGKERRRVKQEAAEETICRYHWGLWVLMVDKNPCCHGHCKIPPLDHPVSRLINDFLRPLNENHVVSSSWHWVQLTERSLSLAPDVLNNSMNTKCAISLLSAIGRRFVDFDKREQNPESCLVFSKRIASFIMMLEDGTDIPDNVWMRGADAKFARLEYGNHRDVLKFFHKRIPCDCLKELYSESRRALPKVGKCYNCKATLERSLLKKCTGCHSSVYCSKQCQRTAWPAHQEFCREMAKACR